MAHMTAPRHHRRTRRSPAAPLQGFPGSAACIWPVVEASATALGTTEAVAAAAAAGAAAGLYAFRPPSVCAAPVVGVGGLQATLVLWLVLPVSCVLLPCAVNAWLVLVLGGCWSALCARSAAPSNRDLSLLRPI
jgi:hypothetical protein